MKKLLIALTLFSSPAYANLQCGIPPIPPIGCQSVCVCSDMFNCGWVNICG